MNQQKHYITNENPLAKISFGRNCRKLKLRTKKENTVFLHIKYLKYK